MALDVCVSVSADVRLCSTDMVHSFIIEGLATVAVALSAFFLIHDFPDTATFLSEEERRWVLQRVKHRGSKNYSRVVVENDKFSWNYVRHALTDWQVYLFILV